MTGFASPCSHEKRLLLAQSALHRLRLRGRVAFVRQSFTGSRGMPARVPAWHRVAFALALSSAGRTRTAGAVRFTGRLLMFARLARTALACAQALEGWRACANVQTTGTVNASLNHPTRSLP